MVCTRSTVISPSATQWNFTEHRVVSQFQSQGCICNKNTQCFTRTVTHVSLKYLYFDGIRVEFEGPSTNNITIEGCVFFSSQNPGTASNAWKKQLKMVNLTQGRLTNNVFMRDSHAYGVAISFAHTVNVTLDNNLCGLKLSQDMHWLSAQVEPKGYWSGKKIN